MPNMYVETLRNLPFLKDAGPEVVERLAAAAVEKKFQLGQVIFEQGSTGCEMYMIVEGWVEVIRDSGPGETLLATRGPGEMFGEMAFFIEDSPRFATIRAVEPVCLLEFSECNLRSVWAKQPQLLYEVIRVLSARLRESDLHMITDLQRKNLELAQAYRELQEAQAALIEKERLEHELGLARDLQQSILPKTFPNVPGFSCAARSQPARQVGGDFYDVILLGDQRVGLVMADVSDKGMSAALYMALTHSLIHAEARRNSSPRQVLLNVHRLLLEMSHANMFVTVFYGVFDLAQGTLCYVRAGHDRPLLFSPGAGECQFLPANGVMLGLLENIVLEEASIPMGSGDMLVLYTDGITDAISTTGELFGAARLREAVCASGGPEAQDLCDFIFESVAGFQGDAPQYDDMAVLVAKAEG